MSDEAHTGGIDLTNNAVVSDKVNGERFEVEAYNDPETGEVRLAVNPGEATGDEWVVETGEASYSRLLALAEDELDELRYLRGDRR